MTVNKQHYIPRMYLKNFAIPFNGKSNAKKKRKIYFYQKNTEHQQICNINNIAFGWYFYNFENLQKTEDYLSQVENKANLILEMIISSSSLEIVEKKENKLVLIEFIINLYLRTIKSRKNLNNELAEQQKLYDMMISPRFQDLSLNAYYSSFKSSRFHRNIFWRFLFIPIIQKFSRHTVKLLEFIQDIYYFTEINNTSIREKNQTSMLWDKYKSMRQLNKKYTRQIWNISKYLITTFSINSILESLFILCSFLKQALTENLKESKQINYYFKENKATIRMGHGNLKKPNNSFPNFIRLLQNKFLQNCEIQKYLYQDWDMNLLQTDGFTPFITSDDPVITLRQTIDENKNEIPQIIFLTLSPLLCLMMVHPNADRTDIHGIVTHSSLIDFINKLHCFNANDYIFSHCKLPVAKIHRFLQNPPSYIWKNTHIRGKLVHYTFIEQKRKYPQFSISI